MTAETGALLAAATTSLPEWIGGERNWDYRFLWHRDAALVVLVLMRLGHRAEASRYLRVLLAHSVREAGALHPMLGLDGRAEGEETVLDHLSGYRDSRPVRVGNSAFAQHQFDVHGQVLDAAFVHQQAALGTEEELTAEELSAAYAVVDEAARRWREPDEGIWEVRRGRRHWTISKVYAWVCFEELCARAGRFGLFSEEMTAEGAMLGNYPQAFTHLAQIDAAMNLDAADDEESLRAWAERTA